MQCIQSNEYARNSTLFILGPDVKAPAAGEMLFEVSNRAPVDSEFCFASIKEGLTKQGTYVLQYEVQPALPGQPALTSSIKVAVSAGQPVSLEVQVGIQPRSLASDCAHCL